MTCNVEDSFACIKQIKAFRGSLFEKVAEKNKNVIWNQATLAEVKKIIIILSASRSGSSLMFSTLREIPELYSLSGESSPYFKVHGFYSDTALSDYVSPAALDDDLARAAVSRDFLSDFSVPENADAVLYEKEVLEEYVRDLLLRFPLQWPQLSFSLEGLESTIRKAFEKYKKSCTSFVTEDFYLELLLFLRSQYKEINPYYYDISEYKIRKKFPQVAISNSPPCEILSIEEPPFILLSPRKKVQAQDLAEKVLLLKTPADCYRLPFIAALFPNAMIKYIYLTRNPAASINGLYDGWQHRGFFSYNLKLATSSSEREALQIIGYSDLYEWGKWWWKYDLPPNWQHYVNHSLERVCAFQWKSAHKHIQEHIKQGKKPVLFVSYEDFIKSYNSRCSILEAICAFIEIDVATLNNVELQTLPLVQVTRAPKRYRWKKRAQQLLPVLKDPEMGKICSFLGYNFEEKGNWI